MPTRRYIESLNALIEKSRLAEDRYEQNSLVQDLDAAIDGYERALRRRTFAVLEAESRRLVLNDCANARLRRYQATGRGWDLKRAIGLWEQLICEAPRGSEGRPGYLSNLGNGTNGPPQLRIWSAPFDSTGAQFVKVRARPIFTYS